MQYCVSVPGLLVEGLNLKGGICQIAHSGSLPWRRRWDFSEDTSLALLMLRKTKAAATEMHRNMPDTLKHLNAFGLFFCYNARDYLIVNLSGGCKFLISILHPSMIVQQSLSVVRQLVEKSNFSLQDAVCLCFYFSSF